MDSSPSPQLQNEDLAEEIEAVNAIYGPATVLIAANPSNAASMQPPIASTITLKIPDHAHTSFLIGFGADYPATQPVVLGTASTKSRGEGRKLVDILSDSVKNVWQDGSVCLFDAIEDVVERFNEVRIADPEEDPPRGVHNGTSSQVVEDPAQLVQASTGLDHLPAWILSDPIIEKKSVFIARVATVTSKDIATTYLDHLLATEKKVATATHNITAWRIRQRLSSGANGASTDEETLIQDFDDDGETAAGGRLLHLMQLMDVWNVVVVVTRWYGGVKLGPDRFRIINAAARDALLKAGFTKSEIPDDKGKKKGKK